MLTTEDKVINLNALKNQDPFATKILDTALRVAVYKFLSKQNEWVLLDISFKIETYFLSYLFFRKNLMLKGRFLFLKGF